MGTSLQTHFPTGMYDMLEEAEAKGHAHVVSWCNGGRSFRIHEQESMIPILKSYFCQTKYKSFLRQLQTYGFTRVTRGDMKGIVSHPLLIRGKRFLCLRMKRKVRGARRESMPLVPNGSNPSLSTSSRSLGNNEFMKTGVAALSSRGRRASTGSIPVKPIGSAKMRGMPASLQVANMLGIPKENRKSCQRSKSAIIPNAAISLDQEHESSNDYPMPSLQNDIMEPDPSAASTIANILDEIDDGLYNHFTKNIDIASHQELIPTMTVVGNEDEEDDWLKGITYEGADIVLEPEKFAMTLPPHLSHRATHADTSIISSEALIM